MDNAFLQDYWELLVTEYCMYRKDNYDMYDFVVVFFIVELSTNIWTFL